MRSTTNGMNVPSSESPNLGDLPCVIAGSHAWIVVICAATALPQTVVDLLTSPGRGPNEADALVQQMKERRDDWRLTL